LAQNEQSFEIQADKVDSNSNIEIQIFYDKFNSWIDSFHKDSAKTQRDEKAMINNFIMFSEDGLIMKNFSLHSVESCKKQIMIDSPNGNYDSKWIYVSMESHVNKRELIEILEFLKEQRIEYIFGFEDEFVPLFLKK